MTIAAPAVALYGYGVSRTSGWQIPFNMKLILLEEITMVILVE